MSFSNLLAQKNFSYHLLKYPSWSFTSHLLRSIVLFLINYHHLFHSFIMKIIVHVNRCWFHFIYLLWIVNVLFYQSFIHLTIHYIFTPFLIQSHYFHWLKMNQLNHLIYSMLQLFQCYFLKIHFKVRIPLFHIQLLVPFWILL